MGNRAIIKGKGTNLGLYVHWNGGYDSVYPMLEYCKLKGYRSPESNSYGLARLCQVYANFFGGGLSVGLETMQHNMTADYVAQQGLDNGVYEIENWQIAKHWGWSGEEVLFHEHVSEEDLKKFLLVIDSRMPEEERLGKDFIMADIIPVENVKIGDEVFIEVYDGYELKTVQGFGKDKYCNGANALNMPYVDLYGKEIDSTGEKHYDLNINNYVRTKTVRRKRKELKEIEHKDVAAISEKARRNNYVENLS